MRQAYPFTLFKPTIIPFLSGSNAFDLPFLSLIGTLDGGGITYAAREFEETAALPADVRKTTFSLILEDVNHSQV